MEMCRCGHVEIRMYGDVEMWRCSCGDVEMWRCGYMKMWRCGNLKL